MESKHEYVIVGGGLAAGSAVEGIRQRDRKGSILLIGREPEMPYERPPLSKQLWFGKKTVEQVFPHGRGWYEDHGVELLLGRAATGLEPAARAVVDDRGDRHAYGKLLLATGGEPRRLSIPGGELDGVCYYRTLADYRRIRERAGDGASAVVIGGGFIGSEMAAALAHVGASVTMIFPEPWLGHRVFPESLGRFLQGQYREHGIRVLAEDVPTSIEARGERLLVTTRGGQKLEADLVVAGIGIRPATELAEGGGLSVNDGIVVDDRLATSDPNVFAAGDNARFPYAALGRPFRVEHWDNAVVQGRHAGANLAGADEPYLHLPYFFSDLFEFGYEAVGEVDARLEIFADWQQENRKGVVYYLADGRVRGAMMCNVWDKVEDARRLIRKGAKADPEELRGAIG